MNISRRIFLGGIGASAAAFLPSRPSSLDEIHSGAEHYFDCALLELKSRCAIRESLQGYQEALADEHHLVESINDSYRYRLFIVPGLGLIDPALAQSLLNLLKKGTHVLLESCAGFLNPTDFAVHQKMLLAYFNLAVLPPVDLWPSRPVDASFFSTRRAHSERNLIKHDSIPYVSYTWPCEAKVRDFSRAIPLSPGEGEVVGRVGALPVALRKRMGGTLVYLGSPLGPALRFGDPEARSWVRLLAAL